MISITDLSIQYGAQVLFQGANLRLDKGHRYGVVGANGSGKSSLLRVISGEEVPTEGDINRPRASRLGVLGQDHFQYDDTRILDVVMMGNAELWAAMVEKEALLERAHIEFDEQRYAALEDVVLRFDGYSLESRAGAILEGLGIPTVEHEKPLRVLSGGYKLRALLGQTLATDPDILLLDEPTNHLDILAIRWLEQFLLSYRGCAIVVSHDHRFLDAACTDILDVDYQRVTAYKGNYAAFLRQKVAERVRQESEISKREKEIADHKAFITRFKAKASKARQANSRQKRLDKVVIQELPRSSRRHPMFQLKARRPSGRKVLDATGIWKAYGDKIVLPDVSFEVHRGDRVAIIGPNGVGKSTLLKILVGEVEADEGSFEWGHEADYGYFPQDHHDALGDPEQTVKAAMWDVCPTEGLGAVYARLALVLFARDDTDKKVEVISGGEAARLLFARLSVLSPTVLVLDEPTNHLDLEGIEALAEALERYDGTLIFVSHDRWFVDRLATRIIEVTPEGIDDFPGTWAEYLAKKSEDHLDADAVVAREKARKSDERRGRKGKGDARGEAGPVEPAPPPKVRKTKGKGRKRGGNADVAAAEPSQDAPPPVDTSDGGGARRTVLRKKGGESAGRKGRRRR